MHGSIWKRCAVAAVGCIVLACAPGPLLRASALESRVDAILKDSYPANGPGAAAIVVHNGQTILRRGFGLADVSHHTPIAPDAVFRVGSITKQFTAVAILQLAAAGKLRLDDDVSRYVPEFPTHGQRITLAELLTHTSGLRNYTALPAFRADQDQALSPDRILAFVRNEPLDFTPGGRWSYCNTGYVLLGAVIERVSGQSYGQYLQEHVFKPAGLAHTSCDEGGPAADGEIAGYSRTLEGGWVAAKRIDGTQAFAAGALRSNVDDLWRWEQALAEGKVLSPRMVALARTPASYDGGRARAGYGMGWELGYIDGCAAAGHGGTISGFRTYEVSVPSLGLYVAILCNADRPRRDPEEVAERIARAVSGETPGRVGVSAVKGRDYAGIYRSSAGQSYSVRVEDGEVLLEPAGFAPRPLSAISAEGASAFIDPENADWYSFQLDAAGRTSGLEIRPRSGVEMVLARM